MEIKAAYEELNARFEHPRDGFEDYTSLVTRVNCHAGPLWDALGVTFHAAFVAKPDSRQHIGEAKLHLEWSWEDSRVWGRRLELASRLFSTATASHHRLLQHHGIETSLAQDA